MSEQVKAKTGEEECYLAPSNDNDRSRLIDDLLVYLPVQLRAVDNDALERLGGGLEHLGGVWLAVTL